MLKLSLLFLVKLLTKKHYERLVDNKLLVAFLVTFLKLFVCIVNLNLCVLILMFDLLEALFTAKTRDVIVKHQ